MDDFNGGNGHDNESDHLAAAIKVSHASLECEVLASRRVTPFESSFARRNVNNRTRCGKYFVQQQTCPLSETASHPNAQITLSSPPSSWNWLIVRKAA